MSNYVFQRLSDSLSDRYRIDREIGAGGMATVFLAHDLRHDRDVAIKVARHTDVRLADTRPRQPHRVVGPATNAEHA